MNTKVTDTSSKGEPMYPNLDNVSFLILTHLFFRCIEDGKPTDGIAWLDAHKLLEYDSRFILANDSLIVNLHRVNKIDFKNQLIYIDDIPVWFDFLDALFMRRLSERSVIDINKEERVITYYPSIPQDPPSCSNPIKGTWNKLLSKMGRGHK